MDKIWIVIKREYLIRVRSKAFIIGTILSPVIMLALIILPSLLAARGGGERRITVLDQSGDAQLFQGIKERLENTGPSSDGRRRFSNTRFKLTQVVVPPDQDVKEVAGTYNESVEKNSDEAYLILGKGVFTDTPPQYVTKNPSDMVISTVERAISDEVKERRLAQSGFGTKAKIEEMIKNVDLETYNPKGEQEKGLPRQIIGFIMLFFIYMTTLFYGIFVMRGVIEEKQSRIVEVVISSVRPFQLMMGKLIGIGMVGLTQYTLWIISAVLLSTVGVSMFASQGVTMPNIPAVWLVYFVVYFILAYFLFATLYAMVGAMVSSEEDAQQAQMPVTMTIVVPMLLFGLVMANPDSPLAVTLSMIPFFAPTLMMLRISMVNPPLYQIIGSMVGMVVTIIALVWVVGRIYRVGILMYGKRPSIAELGKWIRYN